MPSSWPRIILGFLIAPLLVPATYLATAWIFGGFLSFDLAFGMAEFAYAAAVIAVPALLLVARIGWASLHDYIVFGFLTGFIGGSFSVEKPLALSQMPLLGFYGIAAAVAGAGLWLIVRPRAAQQ
ncbi:MAG TPA: hypothetical protein VFS04_01260 [Alphaproteobacteria bacterium]|nr:hypothetical protein [Alphaproteobacteria bacterium]